MSGRGAEAGAMGPPAKKVKFGGTDVRRFVVESTMYRRNPTVSQASKHGVEYPVVQDAILQHPPP